MGIVNSRNSLRNLLVDCRLGGKYVFLGEHFALFRLLVISQLLFDHVFTRCWNSWDGKWCELDVVLALDIMLYGFTAIQLAWGRTVCQI